MKTDLIDEKPPEKEWISPSAEANEILRQQIMESIYPIIKVIEVDEEYQVSVRRILTAIEVAKRIEKDADREFTLLHPDKNTHGHYPSVMDIVATCVAAVVSGADNIKSYPPHSAAGLQVIAFAHASRIISAAWNLDNMMECESDEYGWETAKKLMSAKREG